MNLLVLFYMFVLKYVCPVCPLYLANNIVENPRSVFYTLTNLGPAR